MSVEESEIEKMTRERNAYRDQLHRMRNEYNICHRERAEYKLKMHVWFGKYMMVKEENNALRRKMYQFNRKEKEER